MKPVDHDHWVRLPLTGCFRSAHLTWAEGQAFCLPRSLADRCGLSRFSDTIDAGLLENAAAECDATLVDQLRRRAAFTDDPPWSSRLPVNYQRVPGWCRSLVGSIIGRYQRRRLEQVSGFPAWPLDLSTDLLADLLGGQPSPFAGGPTPVLLTHDLDSPEGLHHLVKWFLDLEESVGARSLSFIVPRDWPIDHGLLATVNQRGHEIGIHGYDHANRTPFMPPDQQRERLAAARKLIGRYGITGYRSPSLLRTRSLLKSLGRFYQFDSSIPTSGGLFPVPNNGCASARPFVLEEKGVRTLFWEGSASEGTELIEIPLSLPRDGSLRFLGYSPQQILDLWIDCAQRISASGGVVVLLTHCEARFSGNRRMLEAYQRFLQFIADDGRFVWVTTRQVLDRSREGRSIPAHETGNRRLRRVGCAPAGQMER